MKTKLCIAGLIAILMASCSYPGYIPSHKKLDVHQYGSHIVITHQSNRSISGELIAVDSMQVFVLRAYPQECLSIPISELKRFSLLYARPKNYGWTIPMGVLLPLIHGFYSILTLPIHLIVTISVASSSAKAFRYNDKHLTLEELKMFARFPQGIPPDVDITSLR